MSSTVDHRIVPPRGRSDPGGARGDQERDGVATEMSQTTMAAARLIVLTTCWLLTLGALDVEVFADGPSQRPRDLRVDAIQVGGGGYTWNATLEGSGRLIVHTGGEVHKINVSRARVRELLEIIDREKFFELADGYGVQKYDAEFRAITIKTAGRSKSLALYTNIARDPRRDEIKRALRVSIAIRSLFDLPTAIDSRQEDQELINQSR